MAPRRSRRLHVAEALPGRSRSGCVLPAGRAFPTATSSTARRPREGWENDTTEIRYGTNYVALRNRLAILDEGYAHADFKTRVLSSFAFITAILEYTNAHAGEIDALVRSSDSETRENKATYVEQRQSEPLTTSHDRR